MNGKKVLSVGVVLSQIFVSTLGINHAEAQRDNSTLQPAPEVSANTADQLIPALVGTLAFAQFDQTVLDQAAMNLQNRFGEICPFEDDFPLNAAVDSFYQELASALEFSGLGLSITMNPLSTGPDDLSRSISITNALLGTEVLISFSQTAAPSGCIRTLVEITGSVHLAETFSSFAHDTDTFSSGGETQARILTLSTTSGDEETTPISFTADPFSFPGSSEPWEPGPNVPISTPIQPIIPPENFCSAVKVTASTLEELAKKCEIRLTNNQRKEIREKFKKLLAHLDSELRRKYPPKGQGSTEEEAKKDLANAVKKLGEELATLGIKKKADCELSDLQFVTAALHEAGIKANLLTIQHTFHVGGGRTVTTWAAFIYSMIDFEKPEWYLNTITFPQLGSIPGEIFTLPFGDIITTGDTDPDDQAKDPTFLGLNVTFPTLENGMVVWSSISPSVIDWILHRVWKSALPNMTQEQVRVALRTAQAEFAFMAFANETLAKRYADLINKLLCKQGIVGLSGPLLSAPHPLNPKELVKISIDGLTHLLTVAYAVKAIDAPENKQSKAELQRGLRLLLSTWWNASRRVGADSPYFLIGKLLDQAITNALKKLNLTIEPDKLIEELFRNDEFGNQVIAEFGKLVIPYLEKEVLPGFDKIQRGE